MAQERNRKRVSELRKRAEKILAEDPQAIRSMATADIQKIIHELNVHQIELEMQNEEFRRVQLDLQEALDKYLSLYDFAPTGYFTLDHNSLILDVNLAGSQLLGSEKHRLIGAEFTASISSDSQDAFHLHYREVLKTSIRVSCELNMLKADGTLFRAQLISLVAPDKEGNINQYRTAVIDITESKQVEKALKLSEQNFRNSMDSSSIGIRIGDVERQTFYVNQAFLDIFGYENVDEVRANPVEEHYMPETYADYILRKEKLLLGEPIPDNVEVDIIRKDGGIRHLQAFRKEVFWDSKQQFQLLYNDITERVQAEEALKLSEQNFRNSMDSSTVGIRIMGDVDYTLYANQTLLAMFGYKNIEELRTSPPQEHYTPESYAGFVERHEKYLNGEPLPEQVEIDINRKDSAVRHLQVSNKYVFWNGKQRFQLLYNDITERVQAEEALRESEEKYRLIVENSRDVIFTLDAAGKVLYISPSITKELGYSPAELIGKPIWSLVHPEDIAAVTNSVQLNIAFGLQNGDGIEYRFRHTSGEWRWYLGKGTTVGDANGKFLNFTGIARDITERKKAEAEKKQLEEKAQVNSRLSAVGEMAAGIAHEINNPLTGVLGFSQRLLDKENVPEEIKGELKIIADGSQRVADIIKRLLIFARQTKPAKTLVNLNELIENTLKLRDYVLKTANIDVVTRFDPELPCSVVDPGQLQQVFLNLIVNAEQAMKGAHGKGTLTITTEKKENNIRMSFTDDGPGITRENMRHLFEPFFTTKDVGEGTGLGLSLSRSIILDHKGTLNVVSEFGHGATFIIELPIIEALPSKVNTVSPAVKVEKLITKKGRILVVDDEPGVRALLEEVLTQSGHSVDVIGDAGSAMEIIDAGTIYDVILADIRIPGMNGVELCSLILRKKPKMKNRIIVITGDVMGTDIKAFLTQNNLSYLSKPFNIEALKEKINAIVMSNAQESDSTETNGR